MSLIIARGKKVSSLYMMQEKLSKCKINAVDKNVSIELWHKRLGHMCEKGMQILARKSLLSEMKSTSLDTCVHCLASKQHRLLVKRIFTSKKITILDLVYSDVCGPMTVSTLGDARYFATFIDDHSRKVWAYALRTKDGVLKGK